MYLLAAPHTPNQLDPRPLSFLPMIFDDHADAEAALDQINRTRRHHRLPDAAIYRVEPA